MHREKNIDTEVISVCCLHFSMTSGEWSALSVVWIVSRFHFAIAHSWNSEHTFMAFTYFHFGQVN